MMHKRVGQTAQRSLYMTNEKELEGGLDAGGGGKWGVVGGWRCAIERKGDLYLEKR